MGWGFDTAKAYSATAPPVVELVETTDRNVRPTGMKTRIDILCHSGLDPESRGAGDRFRLGGRNDR